MIHPHHPLHTSGSQTANASGGPLAPIPTIWVGPTCPRQALCTQPGRGTQEQHRENLLQGSPGPGARSQGKGVCKGLPHVRPGQAPLHACLRAWAVARPRTSAAGLHTHSAGERVL